VPSGNGESQIEHALKCLNVNFANRKCLGDGKFSF
jgi:hypothetical protein